MLLTNAPGVLAALLLLVGPGLVWAWWRYAAPEAATRLVVGVALGLAYQIHVCALLAALWVWGVGITAASVAAATAAGYALAAVLVWRTRPQGLHPHIAWAGTRWRHSAQLVGLLALIGVPRLLPLVVQQVPGGWDPSFHSLLASTTLASHRLPTWAPFEPIPSNYPYGPHVVIAELSLLTGVAPDRVFAVLLDAALPTLTCLALYALARRVLRSHAYAMGVVVAYGLLGYWGSVQYASWGGLPNALGMFVLLSFLVVLFAPGREWSRVVVGGVLLGAIPLTHHHVMLTAVLLLAVYAGYVLLRWRRAAAGSQARRQMAAAFRRLALTAVVAFVTASYYVVPLALRAVILGSTNVGQFLDNYSGIIFDKNGVLLWELTGIGVALMVAGMAAYRDTGKGRPRFALGGVSGQARAFVALASVTLLLAFLFGYYVYGFYNEHFTAAHQPYTLFTPTRFLTDLTYFLPFFAVVPLVWAWQWSASHVPGLRVRPTTARLVSRAAVRVAVAAIVLSTAFSLLNVRGTEGNGQLAPGEAQAFAWIRAHTAPDTLVVNLDPQAVWAPYFTRREVAYTPLPVSEITAGYVDEKRSLTDELLGLMKALGQPRVVATAGMGSALAALAGRPVAVLTNQPLGDSGAPAAFADGPERVYLLGDAFTRMGMTPPGAGAARVLWWQSPTQTPPAGWIAPGTSAGAGWDASAHAAKQGGAAYVRLELAGPLATSAMLACAAEGGATVYVDGAQLAKGCGSGWAPVPALATAGPHVIALRASFGAGVEPWLHVALAEVLS